MHPLCERHRTQRTLETPNGWLLLPVLCLLLALYAPPPATAQLDDSWTITVRGQTVIPNPDGSFRITNISAPDSFGPGGPGTRPDFVSDDFTRLTGFRMVGDVTEYVFSEPFLVVQGETVFIDPQSLIITTIPPPLPVRVQAVPDTPTLTMLGATTQVRVTATLADGSQQDVTPQITWTTYRSSNTDIATVTEDGLVIATGAGSAFITATNEGAATVTRIIVAPGDPLTTVEGLTLHSDGSPVVGATVTIPEQSRTVLSDEDGMFSFADVATTLTDSITVTARYVDSGSSKQQSEGLLLIGATQGLALLPGFTTDAGIIVLNPITLEDLDEDGVPDDVEVFLGFDPTNPDSDGNETLDGDEDGDGDEVPDWIEFVLGFDPSLTDSDGDEIPDSLEDADADGLSDASEILLGLNPFNADTDGDGFGDGEERDNGGDPLDALITPVGTATSQMLSYRFFSADTEGGAPVKTFSEPVSYRYFASGSDNGADVFEISTAVTYRYFAPGSTDGSEIFVISHPVSYRYFVSGAGGDSDLFQTSRPLSYHFYAPGETGIGDLFGLSEGLSYQYE